jgi:hypothetical protein
VTVTYADTSPSGIAVMLGTLIKQNLARDPSRRRLLRPSVVSISASDADVAVTLLIDRRGVRVREGDDPRAHLRLAADSAMLLALTAAPLRFGLPDPFRPEGRAVLGDLLRKRIRVRGMLLHPIRLARLSALLSVR